MDDSIKAVSLGGVGEIGKNMYVIEYKNDMILIDCGLKFPDDDMLGIDYVIPDLRYVLENKDKIRAIVVTHGHEDHVGGIPYLIKELDIPIYSTKLTIGLIKGKLVDQKIEFNENNLIVVEPGKKISLGEFKAEFIRVNHSIPDAISVVLKTDLGNVVYTGDFKFDHTPVDNHLTDIHSLSKVGKEGVVLLLSDSTNAEREGYTRSETVVGKSIKEIFRNVEGRIIIATFASNIHRIQQIIDGTIETKRKIAFVGRSMVNVVNIAKDLGYLKFDNSLVIDVDKINALADSQIVILTTGSQGEPMAALSKMAVGEHRKIKIKKNDTIIISATPIPGNEKSISKIINQLFKLGAKVIYEKSMDIHASGHGSREELKLMLSILKPKYFMPVHGEYRHQIKHAELAKELRMKEESIFIADIGDVIEINKHEGKISYKIECTQTLVDGLGVGDIGRTVLQERKQLSMDGILIVVIKTDKINRKLIGKPEVMSQGFVYIRHSEDVLEAIRNTISKLLENFNIPENLSSSYKNTFKESLSKFIFEKTGRKPVILPLFIDISSKEEAN